MTAVRPTKIPPVILKTKSSIRQNSHCTKGNMFLLHKCRERDTTIKACHRQKEATCLYRQTPKYIFLVKLHSVS